MFNKITNIFLDVMALFILWLLAPLLIVLFSQVAPVYAKIIGVLFIALIMAAVTFQLKRHGLRIYHC
jgi:hypothetical protein